MERLLGLSIVLVMIRVLHPQMAWHHPLRMNCAVRAAPDFHQNKYAPLAYLDSSLSFSPVSSAVLPPLDSVALVMVSR